MLKNSSPGSSPHTKIVKDVKPTISVAVIAYNQEETIAQALDSILCQEGDFKLEVVIGEDAGTDGTLVICQDYEKRYPGVIKLLSGGPNLGIMGNFARTVKACTGDYLAILAGDDYWCDNHKLQKQISFMQEHPEFGVVCSNGYRLMVRTGQLVEGIAPFNPVPGGDVRDYYHDRYGGVYAMPLSLLIRSELMRYVDFDEYILLGFPVEDYPMQSVLAHHTCFGYIPDKTVVYRVHQDSATFVSYDHPRYLTYHKGLVDIRRYLNCLYPEDVPFTDEWASDYLFYKEFLLYLHRLQYKKACALVREAPLIIHQTPHYNQARKAIRTLAHFAAFHFYKKFVLNKDLKNRT